MDEKIITDWLQSPAPPWAQIATDAQHALRHWKESPWSQLPILHLPASQRDTFADSLLQLDTDDRLLRFGHAISDEQIHRYVDTIDWDRDVVLAVLDRSTKLQAGAHIAFTGTEDGGREAEFGVHVVATARRSGLGRRLFQEAQLVARNRGATALLVNAASSNLAMQHIVRQSAATTQRDGPDTSSRLELAAPNVVTQFDETVGRQVAQVVQVEKAVESAVQSAVHWGLDRFPIALDSARRRSTSALRERVRRVAL